MKRRGNLSSTLPSTAPRVSGSDLFGISRKKFLAHRRIEQRHVRLQRRALEPFDDGLRRSHHVIVNAVPDVDPRADRLEQVVIALHRQEIAARRGSCSARPPKGRAPPPRAGPRSPARAYCRASAPRARLPPAALQEAAAALRMIRHPLEHGVGEQKSVRGRRCPRRNVGLDECALRQALTRLAEHVGRRVEADHLAPAESARPEARSSCPARSRDRPPAAAAATAPAPGDRAAAGCAHPRT